MNIKIPNDAGMHLHHKRFFFVLCWFVLLLCLESCKLSHCNCQCQQDDPLETILCLSCVHFSTDTGWGDSNLPIKTPECSFLRTNI